MLFIILITVTFLPKIYTLSLHDALPILWISPKRIPSRIRAVITPNRVRSPWKTNPRNSASSPIGRSEEHTSELQSHSDLVCRLLLEKKKYVSDVSTHRIAPTVLLKILIY